MKSGIVVNYSPNYGDYRLFEWKLIKIDIENNIKLRQNKKKNLRY